MDDAVLQVKQIGNYPAAASVNPGGGDLLLMQQGGIGGPYQSLNPLTMFSTALLQGGFINFAPVTGGIAWNGATLTYGGKGFPSFEFSADLIVPSLHSSGDIFVADEAVATQVYVTELFDSILLNSVTSFNDRTGEVQLTTEDILRAGALPQINPHMAGVCTAPTLWNYNDFSDSIATTAWVQGAIDTAGANGRLVQSFDGRAGNIWLNANDITFALTQPGVYAQANTAASGDSSGRLATTRFVDEALADVKAEVDKDITNISNTLDQKYAPINSPQFTGIPTAPTAAPGTTTGQLATTAYVQAAVTASTTGVSSFNTRTGAVTLTLADVTNAGGAPIASPAFTGNPTAPTQTAGNSSTRLATTAFVGAAIAAIAAGVSSFNTRTGAVVLTAADVTGVGGALLASPALSGTPTAPTAAPATNNTQIATTAYVTTAIAAVPAPVTSFNARTGAVTFQASDISAVGGALLASPNFTGTPTAPTPIAGTNNTDLATTAFVQAAVAAGTAGVTSFNTRTGAVVLTTADITGAGGAVLASPAFTGTPTAPTATAGTNSGQLATTAFVTAAIAASPGGVTSFNSRTGAITLLGSDISAAGGALIASPTFTGTPAAPTATPGTNTTQLATTAFVANAISTAGGVNSFNGRAGVVTLNTADVQSAAGAVYRQAASPPGSANETFWFDQVGGQLYIQYVDPSTSAKTWVVANAPTPPTSPINLPGVTDGSSAPAGMVGEYLTGTGSAAAVTVASYWRNCASLVLSAGDWDVWCDAYTTGMSSMFGIALSLNSGGVEGSTGSGNSDPRPLQLLWGSSTFMGTPFAFDGPFKRVNITTSQTWYLQVMATLATSSQSSGVTTGAIYARRRR